MVALTRRYERYLGRELIGATTLVLLAFLGLFAFFDVINELRYVGQGSYGVGHAAAYVALRLPGRAYELIPICVLIGTLFALANLARHSEINVLRVSGVSTAQLLGALFKWAALFAVLTLLIGEFMTPFSERFAQQLKVRSTSAVVAQEFRSGLWFKDGLAFVNVRHVLPGARLQQVRIYRFDDDLRLISVSEAAEGEYLPPDSWRLIDVVSSRLDEGGLSAGVSREREQLWQSALTPDILTVLSIVPERMALHHLIAYIDHLGANRQRTDRYEIALWKKLFYPFASLVMVALALPFGYTHSRVAGVSVKIFTGVMIGILFHMLNGMFSSLGVIHSWPPLASAAAPSAMFLVAAVAMLWWVERR
jgi:lipopolysaccharide export system permease protein